MAILKSKNSYILGKQKATVSSTAAFINVLKLKELYVLYDDELQERDVRF